jgi:hypothetical protein
MKQITPALVRQLLIVSNIKMESNLFSGSAIAHPHIVLKDRPSLRVGVSIPESRGGSRSPSPCAKRTGGRRSPPSSRRELGVRFSPAFRRNTAGRRPRVPSGTRFTGRPGRSAPLTGRGIEPRDLRSRPVEDPGCRKAPGSRAARAERPSRGGGYAITGEKEMLEV